MVDEVNMPANMKVDPELLKQNEREMEAACRSHEAKDEDTSPLQANDTVTDDVEAKSNILNKDLSGTGDGLASKDPVESLRLSLVSMKRQLEAQEESLQSLGKQVDWLSKTLKWTSGGWILSLVALEALYVYRMRTIGSL
jgi:hypothetical protein